jgi:hypothetical protein
MQQAALGVAPGLHLGVKSTSERARLTLAYAAAAGALRALRQWRDLTAAAAAGAYRRQLAAADAASVHSRVTNALGVPAQLQLDFGDRVCAARTGGRCRGATSERGCVRSERALLLDSCHRARMCRPRVCQDTQVRRSCHAVPRCSCALPRRAHCCSCALPRRAHCCH